MERPILFSGPMVRAILDGSKTQTRRVAKPVAYIRKDQVQQALRSGPFLCRVHPNHDDGFGLVPFYFDAPPVPAAVGDELCRDDGRCQYAIDHGAEGDGHCPTGKCAMPPAAASLFGERTAKDYAIEHAEYMAVAVEYLLTVINDRDGLVLRREESDDVDDSEMQDAGDSVTLNMRAARSAIYEFRKRRDRALAQPAAPVAQERSHRAEVSDDALRQGLRTIIEYPVTHTDNMDAMNIKNIALDTLSRAALEQKT